MNNFRDDFHQIIAQLIALNKTVQSDESYKLMRDDLSAVDYAMNIATVCVDIGRMTGKSEYIRKTADEHTLVVVGSNDIKNAGFSGLLGADVLSVRQIINSTIDLTSYRTIFIDDAKWLPASISLHRLYEKLASKTLDQTFIQLG